MIKQLTLPRFRKRNIFSFASPISNESIFANATRSQTSLYKRGVFGEFYMYFNLKHVVGLVTLTLNLHM